MTFANTQQKMLDQLQQIFREVMDKCDLRITAETRQAQLLEWDSLAQVSLIMAIEKEFDVYFTAKEASGLVSVRAIVDLIEAKTSQAKSVRE